MFAFRKVLVAFLMVLGMLGPAIASANEECVKKHLSNTAFRLNVKLGSPAETDEQKIAAFVTQAGLSISPDDYFGLCEFFGTDAGALAIDDAFLRVFEEVKGDGPFTLQTSFGSFIYQPKTSIEIGIDGRHFAFEFKSKKTGEYLETVNLYTNASPDKPAIYFLISEIDEKISTGSKVSEEFEKLLITSAGYNLLKIDLGAAPCGDVRRLRVRTERARFKIAIKDLNSMLLTDYIDIPTDENEALRKLISECFLKISY